MIVILLFTFVAGMLCGAMLLCAGMMWTCDDGVPMGRGQ